MDSESRDNTASCTVNLQKGARVNNKNNAVCEMKGRFLPHSLGEFGLQTPELKTFCH